MNSTVKRITESAMLIAVGTVLSLIAFQGPWPQGGSITVGSMLPIVLIAHRHGTSWGVLSALTYSLVQLVLGLNNLQWAPTWYSALGIVLFDYVLAFTVIGFAAMFNAKVSDRRASIVLGIAFTFTARFACHFISGVLIWGAIFPNDLGWAASLFSLVYNGSYMLPEILISAFLALLLYLPLGRYWRGEDMVRT